jgi:tetratricopeptide (TPR) repeat protein
MIPTELLQLQSNLLSADADLQATALFQIHKISDVKALEILRKPLILFSQLQLDEDLKNKGLFLLAQKFPDIFFPTLNAEFEIFRSISTFLPWSGQDYTNLQRQNFEAFAKIKNEYDNFFCTAVVYTEFYLDLGRKLYLLFHLEQEAQLIFETILHYKTQNDEAHYSLARILEKQGHLLEALAHYETCIQLNDKHLYAILQAGDLKSTLYQQYTESIILYNKAVEIEPYSADIYYKLARAHAQIEQHGQAKQYAEVALSINEHHEQSLELLGTIAWRIDKSVEKALEFYQKGLDNDLHGDSAILLGAMAELHIESLYDYNKGKLFYQKSLNSQPLQPGRLQKYIQLLTEHFQDVGAAVEAYDNYLKLAPNDEMIKNDYQQFQIKYLNMQPQNPRGEYFSQQVSYDNELVLDNDFLPFGDIDEDDEEVEADAASDGE